MKLQIQSFNTGDSWNKEYEETKLRTYSIVHRFNRPAEANITLADTDGAMLRKYNTDSEVDLAGGVADDGGVETDETTETNSAAADDMTLFPAVGQVNDAYYFGFDDEVGAFTINIGTAVDYGGGGSWTIIWEYSQGADAWAALGGVTDGTSEFENTGAVDVEWTIPGDWATDEVGSISGKYWVRARISVLAGYDNPPTGTQAWYNTVYIGAGKVTIEDPNATDVFYGRIVRAVADYSNRTVILECKDWLDQLDDEKITYDMREKLGTTDLRQSMLRSDVDDGRVAVENDAGTFYAYDDGPYAVNGGMAFVNDSYNGYILVPTVGMAGKNTWRFYAYDSTPVGEDLYDDNPELTWVNQGSVDTCSANNDFVIDYFFHVELGHNTPSDFYVHDSITGARVGMRYQVGGGAANHTHLQIDDKTDGWINLHDMEEEDLFHDDIIEVPDGSWEDIVAADGTATVRFDVDRLGGDAAIAISWLWLEVDVTTQGTSTGYTINDTINPNKLEVATDLTAAATQLWEGVPYCIVKPIYLHMESATGPILGGDTVVTLTAAGGDIENTSGYSTTQFKNKSRLDIMKNLAIQDKASFFIALGTSTVTYQKTFGAHTENMSDATVETWQSVYDYMTMINSVDVYGARLGDYEVYQQSQDATSIAKYRTAKSKVISGAGVVSAVDALSIGTVIAARDSEILQMLSCTLAGFDATYRLGTVVGVTTSYLWATAEKEYVVVSWTYDSAKHKTMLLLHPRSSIGMMPIETLDSQAQHISRTQKRVEDETTIVDPVTHEVA